MEKSHCNTEFYWTSFFRFSLRKIGLLFSQVVRSVSYKQMKELFHGVKGRVGELPLGVTPIGNARSLYFRCIATRFDRKEFQCFMLIEVSFKVVNEEWEKKALICGSGFDRSGANSLKFIHR